MQIFHDAYFEGKIDFKGDVLEILEQRHNWVKFTFTQELFRYVFMDLIPELIVHSKNQDEEQVRDHYDFYSWFLGLRMIYTSGVVLSPDTFESLETLQDNKLAIVCNKLDLKPTDRMMSKSEYPTASLLLSIAMKFMLTSLDDVQTTQTDSNTAKTMALDHLGVIAARVILNLPEDVHTLVSIKLALKYMQLREVESMRAIAWVHQDHNLADFEKAPCDYKDKLSSELIIHLHLTAL
ncbi:hypothetical protein B0H14DRAFT_3586291 [Mycena olivaceomarginata]|nr:hypothetical protein B0H14DRAFT_3586291 [Mycena olivaceomarginata]